MLQQLFGSLVREAEEAVDSYVREAGYSLDVYVKRLAFTLIRLAALSAAGVVLFASGAVFLSVALVELLDLLMPMWASLALVGAGIMGGGGGLLMLARRLARGDARRLRHQLRDR